MHLYYAFKWKHGVCCPYQLIVLKILKTASSSKAVRDTDTSDFNSCNMIPASHIEMLVVLVSGSTVREITHDKLFTIHL